MARKLQAGFAALALQLQEAMDSGDALSANDINTRLSGAIRDHFSGSGTWGYRIDHFGDGESGDVIYSCDGCTYRASYEIVDAAGAAKCSIDFDNAECVVPRTIYEPEAEEEEHYAAMEAALKAEGLYGSLPLYERFISKAERDKAGSDDFAGKGKSFPILKAEDVKAAAASIGRAGSGNMGPSGIKARIIAIAKRKGWESSLPKAWRGGEEKASESAAPAAGSLKLKESIAFAVDIPLREAYAAGSKIKLIAPGKGASAWYTESALKQAATDKIFHAGLPMRIDHPTAAEEAARPEGSVKNWGAVLAHDAEWLESYIGRDGKDSGKGLYSDIKPFSDHAQTIQEKGPYAGVSISANGSALMEAGRTVMRDGVPVLAKFVSAEGADMVTRAGAGGMFLSEAARTANPTEEPGSMTEAEAKKLIEAATAPLRERALRGDAREEAIKLLATVTLPDPAKTRIIERSISAVPMTAEGALDLTKLRETVVRESQAEGEYLAQILGPGQIRGMGIAPAVPALKPEEIAAREAREAAEDKSELAMWESIMGDPKAAKFAAAGRAA